MVSKNDKLGQIVTDDEGKTLYLYTKDTKDTSNCYDKCAAGLASAVDHRRAEGR